MVHERFDIDRWKAEFALDRLREQAREFVLARKEQFPGEYQTQEAVDRHVHIMEPSGNSVTGPSELAIIEQIRDEVFTLRPELAQPSVPTDVFVFGRGEPARREATKIGGLPYWARSRPWPQTRSGTPMQFAAQICFADSRDIVGDLPGEVLLVFFDYDEYYDELDPSVLRLEWADLSETNLVSDADIPTSEYKYIPHYAQIHRTYDYPDAEEAFGDYSASYQLNVIEGTKIGGVPRWIQDDPGLLGRFICAVGSISYSWYQPYAFLNVPEPSGGPQEQPEGYLELMWADVGSLYVFADNKGKLNWDIQYY